MYAVVKTGGKQYRVAEGERLDIERVPGETVTFQPVLVVDGSEVLSTPTQLSAASVTARRSTSVMADGTQITTRGRLKRLTPTRCSKRRIMRCVMSKSVMAPPRNGRTATM